MATHKITIPDFGDVDGDSPIVILGPNGSGKTQLAQRITQANGGNAISAQRQTWVDDSLPVQEEQNLLNNVRSQQAQWHQNPWHPTADINFILSKLIQEHTNRLTRTNEQALESGTPLAPVDDTGLIRLQGLWSRLFPKRKLEISGFFPRVRRLDANESSDPYHLRRMSDGERTVLYMAARVLIAEHPVLVVDEPELHMHSRLSVRFWDEAEGLRTDCRFVYVTHDLNFALSRRRAKVLVARAGGGANAVLVDDLPSTVAAEVLGAATLPFYAKRIFMFEGERGKGFASDLFSSWFDDDETFAVAAGDRSAVCSAVAGLRTIGVVAAHVSGLVDRDFDSDAKLESFPDAVDVLPLHEIESVICDPTLVRHLATHLGKNADDVVAEFVGEIRRTFRNKTLAAVVVRRVRARVGDLLDRAFHGAQIGDTVDDSRDRHVASLTDLALPEKVRLIFQEEQQRVEGAISQGGQSMLAVLPGKHLLTILASVLGLGSSQDLTNLVVRSLDRRLKPEDPMRMLGVRVEEALGVYLPARRTPI
ncbi:MAG: ATP-binding protein [Candidatus Accumulibacter cognatus]|uniref:ATP-binding protein n=1 Tax=Candidatus Accumulibacter cognatus TaxID=2954383 RepID=A0A7D5NEP3_9PROT|nr:MAG: ATP-binding protein [Candidatus Accumulibacter cognatus]